MIVGVVGAGTMGAGIAQLALEHGDEVVLHDVDPAAIDAATERIRAGLGRRAARATQVEGEDGAAGGADAQGWIEDRLALLRSAHTLDTVAADAHVVIEAVVEDLGLKREVLRALDAGAPPDALVATNTSALSISEIAAVCPGGGRFIGLHFFNPVPVMRLVEVVPWGGTAPEVVERAMALVRGWGRTPIRSADRPGFIVNRVHRPFTIEALRLLEAGAADIEAVDGAMREDGFPIGPFALMDLIGIDVNLAVATAIWEGLGRPEHLRPSPIQRDLVEAGRLGRKTGIGFYRYESGRAVGPAEGLSVGTARTDGGATSTAIRDRIRAALEREARAALEEGLASAEDIELALRLGAGHPRPLLT